MEITLESLLISICDCVVSYNNDILWFTTITHFDNFKITLDFGGFELRT